MAQENRQRELAYYYPNPYWYDGDWLKNLILFFDGIAILVPKYMRQRMEDNDPAIVIGLREHNLLHVVSPEEAVDQSTTERLATALTDVIASGALDTLAKDGSAFEELSRSRLGFDGDSELAQMIFEELKKRDLARPSEDGASIPMHPQVRYLVLVLLSQLLCSRHQAEGLIFNPVTDQPLLLGALEELLAIRTAPAEGGIVSFDLAAVGADISAVPLDEVLSFKRQHDTALRTYRTNVRLFAAELSALPEAARTEAFAVRQGELDDLAADLKKHSRHAWKRPASFALSLTGAAWSALTGNPIGAILSISAGAVGYSSPAEPKLGAYSYVFRAGRRLRY